MGKRQRSFVYLFRFSFVDSNITWFVKGKFATPVFTVKLGAQSLCGLLFSPTFLSVLATTSHGETFLLEYQGTIMPSEPVPPEQACALA